MRIFYVSSSKADNKSPDFIFEYLKNNHQVFHYNHDFGEVNDRHSFDEIVDLISNSDVFIGEMSRPSQTLGFQLSFALQLSKPCLYLYDNVSKGKPAGLIGNIPSRNLRTKSYTKENYIGIIDSFIDFAQKQMNTTRTSFMSTKEIDEYLSIHSKKQGISKGELIRQLLHNSIISFNSKD